MSQKNLFMTSQLKKKTVVALQYKNLECSHYLEPLFFLTIFSLLLFASQQAQIMGYSFINIAFLTLFFFFTQPFIMFPVSLFLNTELD